MTLQTLATIYLDNQRVGLMGDPRPSISKIVVAGGKRPELVRVYRARFPGEAQGTPVGPEETIDRMAEPTVAVYLTCVSKPLSPLDIPPMPSATTIEPPVERVLVPVDMPEPHLPGPVPFLAGPQERAL